MREMIIKEWEESIGDRKDLDDKTLNRIVNAWMDDKNNSKHRFDVIKEEIPRAYKILDMASGTGTFVYYGLLNGYDCYGIDPAEWKFRFLKMKAIEYNYPKDWNDRFIKGYGENLPFKDDSFDVVSSYQTLEHVQDIKKCIREMVRVTKSEGGIHIMCPDYRSTFEGHYMLPWLPLFPKKLANIYLKARGRSTKYLTTLNYTTPKKIKKYLLDIGQEEKISLNIVDLNKKKFTKKIQEKNLCFLRNCYFVHYWREYCKRLFRSEMNINYFIYVNKG